jgi:toxin ParE1/3/4
MTPRLVVRPLAQAEIRDARRWYEGQASGLGRRFLGELDAVLARVAEAPHHFPVVERDAVLGEVRRALLRRFPYALTFRQRPDGTIVVLACFHQHRDPEQLRGRD